MKPTRRRVIRSALVSASLVMGLWTPGEAQSISDLRTAMDQGGGWVSFDIVDGIGSFESVTLPTAGITLEGYLQVWEGNPGTWTLKASDLANPASDGAPLLVVEAVSSERVPFSQQTGLFSRLRLDVEWSEAANTTLYVWVGLGRDAPPPPRRGG